MPPTNKSHVGSKPRGPSTDTLFLRSGSRNKPSLHLYIYLFFSVDYCVIVQSMVMSIDIELGWPFDSWESFQTVVVVEETPYSLDPKNMGKRGSPVLERTWRSDTTKVHVSGTDALFWESGNLQSSRGVTFPDTPVSTYLVLSRRHSPGSTSLDKRADGKTEEYFWFNRFCNYVSEQNIG